MIGEALQIRVLSINILSDLALWEKRRSWLAESIAKFSPDLLAVQEARLEPDTAQWLASQLGYPYLYLSPKTGNAGAAEGIAILSRWAFSRQETLDLLTQERVAQWVEVQLDGKKLIFANGHFFWSPSDAPERLTQVELLLDKLKKIPGAPAVVICGDFNSTPESAAIKRLKIEYRSAYQLRHGKEPAYTSPTPLPRSRLHQLHTVVALLRYVNLKKLDLYWRGTLDYIFVNPRIQVLDCQIVLDQPAPGQPKIYPSDHFGLAAILEI